MVATLKTDVIEKSDGSPVDLTGQSATKAYAKINQHSPASVGETLNVSSITDYSSDHTEINFTNNFLNSDYAPVSNGRRSATYTTVEASTFCVCTDLSTSSVHMHSSYVYGTGQYVDSCEISAVYVNGRLA